MSKELVIEFAANGEVEAMHMDEFDLGFLGGKKVERATEIRFDEQSQTWGLFLPGGSLGESLVPEARQWLYVHHGAGFSSYEVARQFEVAWLNICRAEGLNPHDQSAQHVLKILRSCAKILGDGPMTVEEYQQHRRRMLG